MNQVCLIGADGTTGTTGLNSSEANESAGPSVEVLLAKAAIQPKPPAEVWGGLYYMSLHSTHECMQYTDTEEKKLLN